MIKEKELLAEGQGTFCDIIKTALYQKDSTIFERLDFYNDATFLEPCLFAYCGKEHTRMSMQQILFGYYPDEHKPPVFDVYTNLKGVAYLPQYGYIKSNLKQASLKATYLLDEKKLCLKNKEEEIVAEWQPPCYLTTVPTIELTNSFDPYTEELLAAWADVSKESLNTMLAARPVALEQFQPAIEEAFNILKEYLPEELDLYAASTRRIVLFSCSELRNFATRDMHGTIFLNVDEYSNVTFFLEELIHQCSHVVFNAMTYNIEDFFTVDHGKTIGDYLDNTDFRTLYSALHGIYTTGRIVDLFLKIIKHKQDFSSEVLYEMKGRVAINKNRHNIGLEKIPMEKIFTPKGQEIFTYYYQKLDNNLQENAAFFDFDMATHPVVFNFQKFKEDNPIEVG